MKKLKRFLITRGIELFCDNVPTYYLRKLFPTIDPVDVLNGLTTAARWTAERL
jgi:hypothetical protein